MNNFTTIYFKDSFNIDSIDNVSLEELFRVDIGYGHNYINIHTIDRSIVDSVVAEIGQENISEVCYE